MASVKDKRVSPIRTICEVHREMYDKIIDSKIDDKFANEIIDLLEDAYIMGKKMDAKLRQYKNNYDDDWWEKNRNFKKSWNRRKDNKK